MTEQAYTRRSSYGPTSPTVGSRGARTRQQITDAALACFIERGFHATSVEDIASRADTSRATLYQYFESKDAIFSELMYESGTTLIRITRQLGPLGPTAEGYHNLAVWVRDWVANYDRHAPMYIEWQNVIAPASPMRPQVVEFNSRFWKKIAKELTKGGHADAPTLVSAVLVASLLDRYNYIRHVYRPGLSDEQFLTGLTAALQLYLFPSTRLKVLGAAPIAADEPGPSVPPPPVGDIGPLASLPQRNTIQATDPLDGLSPQARATASQLLDAARRVFNANGYQGTNIDQVVAEAGLARGTFYRYFTNRFELLVPLATDASNRMRERFALLPTVARKPVALREWLADMLTLNHHYSGVMRAWSAAYPVDPALLATTSDVVLAMSAAVAELFGDPRPYPLPRRAAGMLLSGLVEHFPNEMTGFPNEPTPTQIVEAQANFVERVVLPPKRRR